MNRSDVLRLADEVATRMVDLGIINLEQGQIIVDDTLMHFDRFSDREARQFLLDAVGAYAAVCQRCARGAQRVHATWGSGPVDSVMLLGDQPNYTDTLTGVPLSGMPEVLLSKCGSCRHLEAHLASSVHPRTEGQKLDGFACKYEPSSERRVPPGRGRRLLTVLPAGFQAPGQKLRALGTGGQVLDRILLDLGERRAGWRPDAPVYVSNAVLCPRVEGGESKGIRVGERKACTPWLQMQMEIVRPPLVVCMGLEAAAYFFEQPRIKDLCGMVFRVNGYRVGVTFHPSSVIRNLDHEEGARIYADIRAHLRGYLDEARKLGEFGIQANRDTNVAVV